MKSKKQKRNLSQQIDGYVPSAEYLKRAKYADQISKLVKKEENSNR